MAQFLAGFNVQANINGAAYVFQTAQCRETTPEADVTNSEGTPGNTANPTAATGRMAVLRTIAHFEATVRNATFDFANNPWSAPATIGSANYINLGIYPAGRANAATVAWGASSFYVRESSQDIDIRQLQPVSFSGISDGAYTIP